MTTPPSPIPHVTQRQARQGRALAIAALATGLVALLTFLVAVLYASSGLIVSAFLGVIAGGIGVAALVMRHRPLAAAVTGLTTGVMAVLLSIVLMVAAVIPPLLQEGTPRDVPLSIPTPRDPDPSALQAPLRMASGGVVFGSGMLPLDGPRMDLLEGPQTRDVDRTNGPIDVIVYVDYRCPHCLSFEEANGVTLQEAAASGNATVEIRPLTFMDRFSEGTAYSSRAAGFLACTVDTQPEDAWLAHSMLLTPDVQPAGEGPGLTNDELLALASIAFPVSDALADCVTTNTFVPFVQLINEWTFSNPVLGATDPALTISGTPSIVIAGELYEGNPADAEGFRGHLMELGVIE